MKETVALVQFPAAVIGYRRYFAVRKDGTILAWGVRVSDSGQGAARALELAREKFNISTAEWTYKAAREARRKFRAAHPELDWTGYPLS